MYIIAEGWISIETQFDGNEFVLERLTRGSVFNHRIFITDDVTKVTIKCLTQVRVYALTKFKFDRFLVNLEKEAMESINRNIYHLFYKKHPLFVDCINYIEPHRLDPVIIIKQRKQKVHRNNILKNVVMNIIWEKRAEQRKPKLRNLIQMMRTKSQRSILLQRLNNYNRFKDRQNLEEKDVKYDFMRQFLERILRLLIIQNDAMTILDNRLNIFHQRKKRRQQFKLENGDYEHRLKQNK